MAERVAGASIDGVVAWIRRSRSRITGTLSIAAVLILMYLLEMILANQLGYAQPSGMFDAARWKSLIAILFGPLVHQTPEHLVTNLTSLLIAGAYIEYTYGERRLFAFATVTGYASIWAVVVYGLTGSVGFSGVTFGLWGWAVIHASFRLTRLMKDHSKVWLVAHFVPLFLGLAQVRKSIQTVLAGPLRGGEISHFIGLVMGIFMGVFFLVQSD